MQNCPQCRTPFEAKDLACSGCGRPRDRVMRADPIAVQASAPPVTAITDGTDVTTGERVTRVSGPLGSSKMKVSDHRVTLDINKGVFGTGAEGRVRRTLMHALRSGDSSCSIEYNPERDKRGEDGRVKTADGEFTLQIVTAPPASDFLRDAAVSSARTDVSLWHAGDWLHDAIRKKYERTSNVDCARTC